MILLAVVIHVCLWVPGYPGLRLVPGLEDQPVWGLWVGLALASIAFAYLLSWAVDVYNPASRRWWRDFTDLRGVRWLAGLSAAAIVALLMWGVVRGGAWPSSFVLGLVSSVLFGSVAHVLGIERSLERLAPRQLPGKLLVPDLGLNRVSTGDIERRCDWDTDGSRYAISVFVRRSVCESFRRQSRNPDSSQWARAYVAEGITGEVLDLASQLHRMGAPFGSFKEVSLVLDCVRAMLRYEADEGEYPKYPVESLADGVGDCEDFSILAAAVLSELGYDVALLFVPGHAALGVAGSAGIQGISVEHEGLRYYYCEMTATGWWIGRLPEEYNPDQIRVSPVMRARSSDA